MIGSQLRDSLIAIARSAGAAVLEHYHAGTPARSKADGSPVTAADHAAEAIILDGLSISYPDCPVVSEEAVEAGHLPKVGARYFLVDPVDGTREFVDRTGEFTVNIALIDNGDPIAGVVYAPAIGRLYAGERSCGAIRQDLKTGSATAETGIATRPVPESGPRVVCTRSHGTGREAALAEAIGAGVPEPAGSSLKFCLVAEGAADLYPRYGRTMIWDTAAGEAVLRAAGGGVVTSQGQPLDYSAQKIASKDLANPRFLAYGDPQSAVIPRCLEALLSRQ